MPPKEIDIIIRREEIKEESEKHQRERKKKESEKKAKASKTNKKKEKKAGKDGGKDAAVCEDTSDSDEVGYTANFGSYGAYTADGKPDERPCY